MAASASIESVMAMCSSQRAHGPTTSFPCRQSKRLAKTWKAISLQRILWRGSKRASANEYMKLGVPASVAISIVSIQCSRIGGANGCKSERQYRMTTELRHRMHDDRSCMKEMARTKEWPARHWCSITMASNCRHHKKPADAIHPAQWDTMSNA